MITDLKPYPAYKGSDSKWLGAVPAMWEVRNLRTLISKRAERNRADLPLLSVAREKGVFIRSLTDVDENHNVIPEDLSNYKVARAGNLVINKMKAWQGSMGIAPCDGIVSPAYYVFDFRIANHAFGQKLLRSKPYVAHFGQASDGVRVGQWDLSIPGMRQIPVLVPPPDEQAAIVRYLDWTNGRLERAIRAKRKVIALLNEERQAIIHRAVTRGLDPSVPLKQSGIPWLVDIPQHWEGRRLSSICSIIVDGTHFSPRNDTAGDYLYITAKSIKERGVDVSSATYVSASAHREIYQRCPVRKGDVLYIKDGATAGLATVNNLEDEFSMLSSVALLRPRPSVATPDFLALALNDSVFKQHALSCVVGGAMTRFTVALLKRFSIVMPPLAEQEHIVSTVSDEVRPLRASETKLEREIELLREFRTRLVADVVTGKLDVRAAAAKLPDESPEPELLDDGDILTEDDEETGDADLDAVPEETEA